MKNCYIRTELLLPRTAINFSEGCQIPEREQHRTLQHRPENRNSMRQLAHSRTASYNLSKVGKTTQHCMLQSGYPLTSIGHVLHTSSRDMPPWILSWPRPPSTLHSRRREGCGQPVLVPPFTGGGMTTGRRSMCRTLADPNTDPATLTSLLFF